MRVYRQTAQRHRALLIAPVVVAATIAGWFTLGAPPAYRSSATIWVDNGSSVPSYLVDGYTEPTNSTSASSSASSSADGGDVPTAGSASGQAGPAALEAQVVSELLLTPSFDSAVSGNPPPFGYGGSPSSAGSFSPRKVAVVPAGPQVLKLSYDGPSPLRARTVLDSLIRQLGVAGSSFGYGIGKTASDFYRRELTAANSVVASNQGSLAVYARAHPKANARNDATFRALATELRLAVAQRASVQAANSKAGLEAQRNSGSATMAVFDPPTLPQAQVMGLAPRLMGVVSGAIAGAVISLLALLVFTPRPPLRWDAEVPLFARLAARDKVGWRTRGRSAGPAAARAARRRQDLHRWQQGV